MEGLTRTGSSGFRKAALSLTSVTVAMLTTAAGTGVAAGKDEPGSQRSATGQAHSRAVTGTPPAPARSPSRAAPQRRATSAPQRSSSAGTTGRSSGRGANVSGPYDPSGVGLPSGNGKSEDNNGRRPCAGCVGRADTKNPPGQLPGGNDSNRGYECDENEGVGKTNPAHSRCSTTPTSGPGTRPTPSVGPSVARPLGVLSPAVLAKAPPLVPADAVRGVQQAGPRDAADNPVLGAQSGDAKASPAPTAPELAFTGLGLAWMALLGAAFVASGGALRRRTAPAELEEVSV